MIMTDYEIAVMYQNKIHDKILECLQKPYPFCDDNVNKIEYLWGELDPNVRDTVVCRSKGLKVLDVLSTIIPD